MSDLEFRRELSPEQIREALSLLDSAVGAQNQNLRIGDLRPAEEVNLEPDQSSTTMATQDRPPTAEELQQRKKRLNLAVAVFGIGMAAAGALALSSSRESGPPSPMPGIDHEQPREQSSAPAAQSDPPAAPVAQSPPDQSPGGSERQPLLPEPAGSSAAVRDAANSDSALLPVARAAANQAAATSPASWNERVSQRPEHTWWHARAVRVAAAKKRFRRLYWQARGDEQWCIFACRRPDGEWCFFACRTWRTQPVFYQPPRNVTR